MELKPGDERLFQLDSRLDRRAGERIIAKRYASAFKGTNLDENLTALSVDTLIVAGVCTSHCIYATCRDPTDSFRVIVPLDIGDVLPLESVLSYLDALGHSPGTQAKR
jgi:nicotinamidase-related amidase